jgi:hypothetical protein
MTNRTLDPLDPRCAHEFVTFDEETGDGPETYCKHCLGDEGAHTQYASNIFEREDDPELPGSVREDISGMSLADMEYYFMDADPAAFL